MTNFIRDHPLKIALTLVSTLSLLSLSSKAAAPHEGLFAFELSKKVFDDLLTQTNEDGVIPRLVEAYP
jgi:hypothetical protein